MMPAEMSNIEKRILLRVPRDRVWRALADVEEFSKWFGVECDAKFEPGARVRMTATKKGYQGMVVYATIERMEPGVLLSWRWHPGAPKLDVDYSKEPTTLVEFRLEDADGGTLLTVVETGFDQISLARRAGVYKDNNQGWDQQTESLERYVGTAK
ncbi:MAG TPA: SRPBCC family protein [Bryobacteraceae bacterium]|nr:SRPBCC family protein [Bryobacteraceae bacterium]